MSKTPGCCNNCGGLIGGTCCHSDPEPFGDERDSKWCLPVYTYHLTYTQGQQVAEVLRRYIGEELEPQLTAKLNWNGGEDLGEVKKDIAYIRELEALFRRPADEEKKG